MQDLRPAVSVAAKDWLSALNQFESQGRPYALVTVLRSEPPASARAGDKAVVTSDGAFYGWIGGAAPSLWLGGLSTSLWLLGFQSHFELRQIRERRCPKASKRYQWPATQVAALSFLSSHTNLLFHCIYMGRRRLPMCSLISQAESEYQ
jgi:Xanthine and CO dehydrogenases maturation factor, XdhC/CoxF family